MRQRSFKRRQNLIILTRRSRVRFASSASQALCGRSSTVPGARNAGAAAVAADAYRDGEEVRPAEGGLLPAVEGEARPEAVACVGLGPWALTSAEALAAVGEAEGP